MTSVWQTPELSNEIARNDGMSKNIPSIISDIMCDRLTIVELVENMSGILTNKDVENREKGMQFFSTLLGSFPSDYLNEVQLNFISKFYTDRLKDNHRVIPAVLNGYLTIINMNNFNMHRSLEFCNVLFREVPCQSQVRQDRHQIYMIIQKIVEKSPESIKMVGPDFIYGFISCMDGERDPRNLMFLFTFIPTLISQVSLGTLVDEMFEVISCYYPIDFHPSPSDPAPVTRDELAAALSPCLCATPEFGEQCLVLLIEKLDSSLKVAKLDSLKLLRDSCNTFTADSYGPFLKALWSSIHREIMHKTDEELRLAAHEALSTLVLKLSSSANTDEAFENFVKGIIILIQSSIAEASTVTQFTLATKVLLTTANASKESCIVVVQHMVPAILAYYDFKQSSKLQIASLNFVGDLYELAEHWGVIMELETQLKEIPQLCLTAISIPSKDFQIAGFKTLMRVNKVLKTELIVPFVEVLIYNIQHSHDSDLLGVSVQTIHVIAQRYPELIMSLVVNGKCDLENVIQDKEGLERRLNLLCSLASINDFTKIIIESMLKLLTTGNEDASKIITALSTTMSNSSIFSKEKVTEIESDHGLVTSVITWLRSEIHQGARESLNHGFSLVATTMSNLSEERQQKILDDYAPDILELCDGNDVYYNIIHSLYSSLQYNLFDSKMVDVLALSLHIGLQHDDNQLRLKAQTLIAHFLNKAESGECFELLYEQVISGLKQCSRDELKLCGRLINLYGWITKGLVMRGSDLFLFWLQKTTASLTCEEFAFVGAGAIKVIMTEHPEYLTGRQNCRVSLLYKQRMFQAFLKLAEQLADDPDVVKEAYLLSWSYVLEKVPKTVLDGQMAQVSSLAMESLQFDNCELALRMLDVVSRAAALAEPGLPRALPALLPRLAGLAASPRSMDVRIKSLQCLFEIASSYSTAALLPHKGDVLAALAGPLDDRKRLVRAAAVRARARWFLVGAPGEQKPN